MLQTRISEAATWPGCNHCGGRPDEPRPSPHLDTCRYRNSWRIRSYLHQLQC